MDDFKQHLMFRISIFVPCILLMLPFSRSLNVCKVVRHRSFSAFQSTDKNASPTSIEYKVMQFLSNECKISANSYILLSVSGGLDSMALLHILSSISNKNIPLNLEVISFNHKLREESDEEVNRNIRTFRGFLNQLHQ